ncbi:hypothetical protein HMPREF0185_02737 [Brevundimonas diminuta 470-4]|nr:hypothetical protein HMPREF0185_02737 [Brevundimonas diminuta 470-4]
MIIAPIIWDIGNIFPAKVDAPHYGRFKSELRRTPRATQVFDSSMRRSRGRLPSTHKSVSDATPASDGSAQR